MARSGLLDTEIPTKTHNRAEQVGMHGLAAVPTLAPVSRGAQNWPFWHVATDK